MASLSNNIRASLINKADVVQFVGDITANSLPDSPLTITITPVKYEDYSVIIAIGEWLDDIETPIFYEEWQTISTKEQDGSFLKEKEQ